MVDYGCGRYLPEEIVFDEILSRLPAPIVVQLKTVCKLWHNTICSQRFAKIHLNKRRCSLPPGKLKVQFQKKGGRCPSSPPVLLSENGRFRCPVGSLYPANNELGGVRIMDSCDGLIVALGNTWHNEDVYYNMYVFNPVIGFIVRLPPAPVFVGKAVLFVDDVVHKYKLLAWDTTKISPRVHLFDFVGWCWKTFAIPMDMNHIRFCRKTKPLFSKGCLYWPDDRGGGVLLLDFTSGVSRVIKFWYDISIYGVSHFDFRFLIMDGSLYGLQSHSSLDLEDWHIIWVLLPCNFEWAIYHRHGNLKPKNPNTKLYLHDGFNNYSTVPVSSVITIPPALLLHQFKLIYLAYEILSSFGTAHMDTLISLDDTMTPDLP